MWYVVSNTLVKIQCIVGASLNINASRTNACAKKYMHITMASYIELHTQNKRTCHESSSLAVKLFTNHRC